MRRPAIRAFGATVTAAVVAARLLAIAHADPVPVFPGMEIHQGSHLCTLGYVDPGLRVAFTAGHCRGDGPVTDKDNKLIGNLATFRDNTPNGAFVKTDQQVDDYESIVLAPDVAVNNILPGGRVLQSDPGLVVTPGEPVCHFGVITGESCGTVESVNNGWFTMGHGAVSQPGDSGGPVYITDPGGPTRIVGIFNSVWGQFPAAVSWQSTTQEVREDVGIGGPSI
ncbi:Rv1815 family serine proteinase [Mycobacterium sp.]|uniref:Rv1815 family serine proteinase n=1 Tax=Mycobacterium sp. TaxID=1785 RepID=UPI003F9E5937